MHFRIDEIRYFPACFLHDTLPPLEYKFYEGRELMGYLLLKYAVTTMYLTCSMSLNIFFSGKEGRKERKKPLFGHLVGLQMAV
jgi:hypothetical protein